MGTAYIVGLFHGGSLTLLIINIWFHFQVDSWLAVAALLWMLTCLVTVFWEQP